MILIKAVKESLSTKTRKDIGNLGEKSAAEYLKKQGFSILERNLVRKIGEIDIVAKRHSTIHIIEVKTRLCREFPTEVTGLLYSPTDNLDARKLHQVTRVGQWYVAEKKWEGEWQIDAVVVWLRERDSAAQVEYLPQIA